MARTASDDKVLRIRALNDAFRTTFRGGKVVTTASVAALPNMVVAEAFTRVASFDNFTPDNDSYDEHDFGALELCGRTFFWKIDAYDKNLKHGSEDPSDPEKTTRVLTLMLAEDY